MRTRNAITVIAVGLLLFGLPGLAGAADQQPATNAEIDVETEPVAFTKGTDADVFIYDDDLNGYYAAALAADNLAISYDFSSNPSDLANAASSGSHSTIVVNSQLSALSFSEPNIFATLADYAENDGRLIFQAWELDLCGGWSLPCSASSVDAVLAATGAERPLDTSFSAQDIATSDNVCTGMLLPNPFLPLGLSTIETADANPYIRVAQGAQVSDGTSCFVNADDAGISQVVTGGDDVYVGVLPGAYIDVDGDADGTDDIVELYENLLSPLSLSLP